MIELGLGIAFGIGIILIVEHFTVPLAILTLSVTIASALSPIVAWLNRWLPRSFALALVYIMLLLLIGLAGWVLIPILIRQTRDVFDKVPSLLTSLLHWMERWQLDSNVQLNSLLSSAANRVSMVLFSLPVQIASSLLEVAIIIFLSFYWLLAEPQFGAFIRSLFPEHEHAQVHRVLAAMGKEMGGYVRGIVLNALAVGTLAGLGLYFVGINYPIFLGTITAFGEFIPYIGPIIASIPAIGVGFLQSPGKALLALIVYTAVQQIEGHLLTPNIMRSQTDIPQALVIFALLAGGSIGGILGAIVAVPIAGVLRVLVREVIAPAIRRWSGAAQHSQDQDKHE